MPGRLKIHLVYIMFSYISKFRTNVIIFVLHFCKIYSLTLQLLWLTELLLHKGSIKMDEYYGMF